MNTRRTRRYFENELAALHEAAHAELLLRAREILKRKNAAHSFCIGMGTATFYTKDKEIIPELIQKSANHGWDTHYVKGAKYLQPFYDFLNELDSALKLTGSPARIDSPDAPVITDW